VYICKVYESASLCCEFLYCCASRTIIAVVMQLRYGQESKEVDLRRAFDKLDTKRDNKIDADELLAFFRSAGESTTKVYDFLP
jgi:hypothetical protein